MRIRKLKNGKGGNSRRRKGVPERLVKEKGNGREREREREREKRKRWGSVEMKMENEE